MENMTGWVFFPESFHFNQELFFFWWDVDLTRSAPFAHRVPLLELW